MSPPASLSLQHEVLEQFEDAARKLRERFRSSVTEALPGFARRLFELEWQESADITIIESVPPLTLVYLMRLRAVRV